MCFPYSSVRPLEYKECGCVLDDHTQVPPGRHCHFQSVSIISASSQTPLFNILRHVKKSFFLVSDNESSFERFPIHWHPGAIFPIDHTHGRLTCLSPFQPTRKNKVVRASVAIAECIGDFDAVI